MMTLEREINDVIVEKIPWADFTPAYAVAAAATGDAFALAVALEKIPLAAEEADESDEVVMVSRECVLGTNIKIVWWRKRLLWIRCTESGLDLAV